MQSAIFTEPSNENQTDKTMNLEHYEKIIETGLKSLTETGNALIQIRDNKLYKENYPTFDEYCRKRWQMTKRRAYQLISHANIVEEMGTMVHKPTNERQTRQLAKVDKDKREDTWKAAQEATGSEQPSGSDIGKVININHHRPQEVEPFDHVQGSMDEEKSIFEDMEQQIQDLKDQLALDHSDMSEEARDKLYQELTKLRNTVKQLNAELISVKAVRDKLQEENAQLRRQVYAIKHQKQA